MFASKLFSNASAELQSRITLKFGSKTQSERIGSSAFAKDSTPTFGTPAGYGVAQLDPPSLDNQYWSWIENRAAGVIKYAQCTTVAANWAAHVRRGTKLDRTAYQNATDLSADSLIYDRFQLNQGGHYWVWHPVKRGNKNSAGLWVAQPWIAPGASISYGAEAYGILDSVSHNLYRPDW